MTDETIMAVEDVSFHYPNTSTPVVRDINLAQRRGEFLAIVGPSGGGKTTLLRLISGLLRPQIGRVLHAGKEVNGPPPWLSVVFQDYTRSLYPWMTVRENVMFGLRRLPKKARGEAADSALALVGLDHAVRQYPWQISGGMQQRCALARSLAAQPGLLLLDEPFASVDAQTREDLQDLVLALTREFSLSTLLVTHDVDEAIYMADRVVVLSSRPARTVEDIPVRLSGYRNQLVTKSLPEFLKLREEVHRAVRRETNLTKPALPFPRNQ